MQIELSLKKISSRISKFLSDQRGATATEYAVILAGLVLAILGVVFFLQAQSETIFNSVGGQAGQFGKIE